MSTGRESLHSSLRRAKDASTRFNRAVLFLAHEADMGQPHSERRWLIGYEANTLLWKTLADARMLVGLLNDDVDDEAEHAAKTLYEALRARRLAAKLEQVEGRTDAEAETFQAKARELRGV